MTRKIFFSIILMGILFQTNSLFADVPGEISFQGFLSDTDGKPVSDNTLVDFALYDVAEGGVALWEEEQQITIENGIFNAVLGGKTPIDPAIFKSGKIFAEVIIGNEPLLPRLEITSGGYCFIAQEALNVPGKEDIFGWIDKQGYVKSGTCTAGQMLKWDGSAWQCVEESGGKIYKPGTAIDIDSENGINVVFGTTPATAAAGNHNHDNTYAVTFHNHDSVYSKTTHNHDSVYSATAHNHDTFYSQESHNHNDLYYKKYETDAKFSGYTLIGHNHYDIHAKLIHNHDDIYYTKNEIEGKLIDTENKAKDYSDTLSSNINASLASHNHDDVYYLKADADAMLTGKSDTDHNHDAVYVVMGEAGSVSGDMIVEGTIPGNAFADNAVNSAKIEDKSILFDDLNDNTCSPGEIIKKKDEGWGCGEDISSEGTVTSIETGAPLSGGPITKTGVISISKAGIKTDGYLAAYDFNQFASKQNRVTETCAEGSSIREIKTDGTVTCEEDTDTVFTNGTGINITDGLISLTSEYANGDVYDWRFVNATGDSINGNVTIIGNVGIGTLSPNRTLDVSGTIKATSFEGDAAGLTNVTASNSNKVNGFYAYATPTPNALLALNNSGVLPASITGSASNVTGVVAIENGGTGMAVKNFVDLQTNQTIAGTKTFNNTISGNISGTASNVTGIVAVTNGGTGSSTQNFVDLTYDQTIGGNKTFSNTITGNISGNAGTVTNGVYTTGNQTIGGTKTFSSTITGSISGNAGTVTNGVYVTGNYAEPGWLTSINASKITGVLGLTNGGTGSSTQNFVDLTTNQSIGGNKTFTGNVTCNNTITGNVSGTASNVTGIVGLTNGGTGSSTKNFVDLSTDQSIGGNKTFSGINTFSNTINGNISGTSANVTGTVAVANGGTGIASYANGDLIYASATTSFSRLAAGGSNTALLSGTPPSWGKIGLTTHVSGTLAVGNGGTNIASYTTGDMLYASGSAALSKLAAVATGSALISKGTGTAPAWGKIDLATVVSGALPVGNGGTNITSYTTGDIIYASAATTLSKLSAVAIGNALISKGTGTAPAWGKIDLATVVSGVLPLGNGGTGSSTQNFVDISSEQSGIAGNKTFTGNVTFSNTITGNISGNAGTVTNGVYITGDQTIGGNKTFSSIITGSITGNAGTVTGGVYTTGDQTIGGNKTFSSTINVNGSAYLATTSGNVGIGITTPQATLDVNGFARLKPYSLEPAVCDSTTAGSVALTSLYKLCICDGMAIPVKWIHVHDGSDCVW